MTSAPAIYAPRPSIQRLGLGARILAIAIAAGCLAMLVAGARLAPNPAGIGTHTGLGFQPCGFLYRTGIPCPSCGMTTSVSYLLHGQPLASLWVQPMGTVIALTAAIAFWVAGYMALSGRSALRLMQGLPAGYYLLYLMGFAIAAWGWKIFIHWRGIDGWG